MLVIARTALPPRSILAPDVSDFLSTVGISVSPHYYRTLIMVTFLNKADGSMLL